MCCARRRLAAAHGMEVADGRLGKIASARQALYRWSIQRRRTDRLVCYVAALGKRCRR
jgi:hypothetical protein